MKTFHETAREQAEECIAYYEQLFQDQWPGQNWALGLFMAKQWRRMLEAEAPDLEEIRLFSAALNNDWGTGSCGGSQWCSMAVDLRHWLESLELEQGR